MEIYIGTSTPLVFGTYGYLINHKIVICIYKVLVYNIFIFCVQERLLVLVYIMLKETGHELFVPFDQNRRLYNKGPISNPEGGGSKPVPKFLFNLINFALMCHEPNKKPLLYEMITSITPLLIRTKMSAVVYSKH